MTSILYAMAVGPMGAPVILKASPPILPTHYERSVKITTSRLPTQPILTGKLIVPRGFLKVTLTGQGFDKNGGRVAMPPVRFSIFNPNAFKSASHTFTPDSNVASFQISSQLGSQIQEALFPEDPSRLRPVEIRLSLATGAQSGFIGKLELDGPAPFHVIYPATPAVSPLSRSVAARMASGKTYIAVFSAVETRTTSSGSGTVSPFGPPAMELEMTGKSTGLTAPIQSKLKLTRPQFITISASAIIAAGAADLTVRATAKRKLENSQVRTSLQLREYSGGYSVQWNDPTIVR